ncbi:hypothetical protein NE865_07927 [Phthorimaea operculella]|nr:hypothetical protein NE865_07927 [Phthorimaea operculella]
MNSANQLVCSGCRSPINDDHYLCCCTCEKEEDKYYDLTCANVSLKDFKDSMTAHTKSKWRCVMCVSKTYTARSDGTPATPTSTHKDTGFVNTNRRGASMQCSPPVIPEQPELHEKFDRMLEELKGFRGEFLREAQVTRKQIADLNESFTKLLARVESCENRLDIVTSRMDVLEQRVSAGGGSGSAENIALRESVEELKSELNQRDQDLLMNDIEITCVPEHNNENLQHITINLARKIGVVLTDKDIVHTSRAGRIQNAAEEGAKQRPRPIIVTLARRALRDELLKAARVRRGATTENMDIPGPVCRFYVNERLTRINRLLFRRARELGDQHHWRFIWTRDGKIFARQHAGRDAPRHRIRVEKDLDRVFGSGTHSSP